MGFRIPDSEEKQLEKHNKRYFEHNETKVHISDFQDKTITVEMKENMRMNSYVLDDLPPKLTDEALIEMANQYHSHCSIPRFPCGTYNEALIHKILPELIKRLEEK